MGITEFSFIEICLFVLAILFFILMIWTSITFIIEKKNKAIIKALIIAFLLPTILLFPVLIEFQFHIVLEWIFLVFILLALIVLLPLNFISGYYDPVPSEKHDERDIMFSRSDLVPGSENYKTYYETRLDVKRADDLFRDNPGLLSREALFYHPWFFASTKANFNTVLAYHDISDGPVSKHKSEYDPLSLKNYIKTWAKYCGAHSVGITYLQDYHLYSYGGRFYNYGKQVRNTHKYAIALTVEMNYKLIDYAPKGPVITESAYQYLRSGTIAIQIASFIRELGYSARAHIDAHYDIVCPLVARDAGLGEIGRMGLLMTPDLGPRVRIAVITTELQLPIDNRKPDYSVIDFCRLCKKCSINCPAAAIPGKDWTQIKNVQRWKINSEVCYTYWTKTGMDCGQCIMVCPYSHPDYLIHKGIRFFVKRSYIFRQLAVLLDDIFYGKHPRPKDLSSENSGFRF